MNLNAFRMNTSYQREFPVSNGRIRYLAENSELTWRSVMFILVENDHRQR